MSRTRFLVFLTVIGLLPMSVPPSSGTSAPPPDDLQSKIRVRVKSDLVGAGDFGWDFSICPVGTVAMGGGVDTAGPLDLTLVTTGPTINSRTMKSMGAGTYGPANGWFGGAKSSALGSEPFKLGAICVPRSSDTSTIVVAGTVSSFFGHKELVCPADTVALGGGVDVSNMSNMTVTSSAPLFGGMMPSLISPGVYAAPGGWGGGAARGATDQSFYVGVVCGQMTGIRSVVVHGSLPAHGTTHLEAACPVGFAAIGGGVSATNLYTAQVTASGPAYGPDLAGMISGPDGLRPAPDGWEADVRNDGATTPTVAVVAICAHWPLVYFTGDEPPTPDR